MQSVDMLVDGAVISAMMYTNVMTQRRQNLSPVSLYVFNNISLQQLSVGLS